MPGPRRSGPVGGNARTVELALSALRPDLGVYNDFAEDAGEERPMQGSMSTSVPSDDASTAGAIPAPIGPSPAGSANAGGPDASASSSGPPDPVAPDSGAPDQSSDVRLIQETRNQIRQIVQEITQLAQSDVDLDVFYGEFLTRVVSALASVGGAIWTVGDEGLSLRYQINLPRGPLHDDAASAQRHHLLMQRVLADGQPTLVPPQAGSQDEADAGNPTEHLLIFAMVCFEDRPVELIEIFQRPTGGPTTQRGYLRFLVQMCELAHGFVTRHRLRNFQDRESLWEGLEQFIRGVHRDLDVQETSYALVNEARRLLRCDRVSVAIRHGRRYQVEAVSGLDALDRRAQEIRLLGDVARRVSDSGQSLVRRDTDETPLAPQIEDALDAYLDVAHSKLTIVEPLYGPEEEATNDDSSNSRREPIGALIVEQLRDSRTEPGLDQRLAMIAAHGGSALANSLQHDRIFLMPLWRAVGRSKLLLQARTLPKTLLVAAAIAVVIAALALIPAPLKLTCNGQLVPARRNHVFAQTDGVVAELPVRHGLIVEQGDLLVRLRSAQLRERRTRLEGELDEKRQQFDARNMVLVRNERLDPIEQQRIEGEVRRLETSIANLRERLRLLSVEEEGLQLRADSRAQVATWRLQQRLWNRPVRRGEVLMTLFDPDADWELELWMPERRMGHIEDALKAQPDQPLPVSFVLASHPDERFEGQLFEVQHTADVREGEGNVVRLRVRIDKAQLPELRNEANLTAQVHCGTRAVGAVWFGDLLETVQKTMLLWLP